MKTYITFGQIHAHRVNCVTLDRDCIAVITGNSYAENRAQAFELFGMKFHQAFTEEEWNANKDRILQYFPRGLVEI